MKLTAPLTTIVLVALLSIGVESQRINGSRDISSTTSRILKKNKKSKEPKGRKDKKKSAKRALTMWWVLFNKPSACEANPEGPIFCGLSDVMGNAMAGTNHPDIAIISATGGISDKKGNLLLTASLYKTACALDLVSGTTDQYATGGPPELYDFLGSSKGYCPADGEETEIHLVLRDHGPVTDDKMWQITRFTDPSCIANGGPNTCVDSGVAAFAPLTEDGYVSKDVMGFPMYPPGCAEAGACTEVEEAVQLSGGMATLIKTGDAIQAVVEVTLPKV